MLASYNIAMLSLPNRFKQLTAETRTLFFVRKIHSNHASMQAAVPHPVTSGLLPQTDKDSTTTEKRCLHQAPHLGHALAAADDANLGAGRIGHAEHGALLQRPSHEPGLRSAQQAGSINAWCHAIARPQP
jgi:hypothetical protein